MNGALAPNRNDVCSALMARASLVSRRGPAAAGRLALSALHGLKHFLAQGSGRISHPDPHRAHDVDLVFRGVVTSGDDGAGMAHAPARRGSASGDEADAGA